MLNYGGLKHVARGVGLSEDDLRLLLDDFDERPERLVKELTIWPANHRKKSRDVVCAINDWGLIQKRLYLKVLLPNLLPTKIMHGGVKGRSPATNARAHLGNRFAFVTDVSGFFPSIKCRAVHKVFLRQGCGPEAARALTRLCTYDFHLAQGLTTSQILANECFKPADDHILNACRSLGATYTRFADDITISANFDLRGTTIDSIVRNIVGRYGFKLAEEKTNFGRLDHDVCITGVRLSGDHINPSTEFIDEINRLIADHQSLGENGPFEGPLLMESELCGKARYACYLNSGYKRMILPKLRMVKWDAVMNNAIDRELCRYRDRTAKRGEARSSAEEPLSLAAGYKAYRKFRETQTIDPNRAPWE